jgi:hypothetical protein
MPVVFISYAYWAGVCREFVTSNDKPRIVAYRYIIEASIDVS